MLSKEQSNIRSKKLPKTVSAVRLYGGEEDFGGLAFFVKKRLKQQPVSADIYIKYRISH